MKAASTQDVGSELHPLTNHEDFSSSLFSFTLALAWKYKATVHISQATAKEGNLSECQIYHQRLRSLHDARELLVLPVPTLLPFPMSHKLQSTPLRSLLPSSTFMSRTAKALFLPFSNSNCNLCLIVSTQLDTNTYIKLSTFAALCCHDYLNQIYPQSQKDLTSSTHLCKVFTPTLHFRLGDLLLKR